MMYKNKAAGYSCRLICILE